MMSRLRRTLLVGVLVVAMLSSVTPAMGWYLGRPWSDYSVQGVPFLGYFHDPSPGFDFAPKCPEKITTVTQEIAGQFQLGFLANEPGNTYPYEVEIWIGKKAPVDFFNCRDPYAAIPTPIKFYFFSPQSYHAPVTLPPGWPSHASDINTNGMIQVYSGKSVDSGVLGDPYDNAWIPADGVSGAPNTWHPFSFKPFDPTNGAGKYLAFEANTTYHAYILVGFNGECNNWTHYELPFCTGDGGGQPPFGETSLTVEPCVGPCGVDAKATTVGLKVVECNKGNVPLHDVKVEIYSDATVDGSGNPATLVATLGYGSGMIPPSNESSAGGVAQVLDVGECWTWECTAVNVALDLSGTQVTRTYTSTGSGWTPHDIEGYPSEEITWPLHDKERVVVSVDQERPGTQLTVESKPAAGSMLDPGASIEMTVTECNVGNVPLYGVSVTGHKSTNGDWTQYFVDVVAKSANDNGDDVLDPGECWTWFFNGVMDPTNVCYDFYGTGNTRVDAQDPCNVVVDSTYDPREHKQVCFGRAGFARTPGYWQTHKCMVDWLVPYILSKQPNYFLIVDCADNANDKYLTDAADVMGMLWCDRSDSYAAQLGRQLTCALLNLAVPGHSGWSGGGYNTLEELIAAGQQALCNGATQAEMSQLVGYLDDYNNSGEFGQWPTFDPWTKGYVGGKTDCRYKAQGDAGKYAADYDHWCNWLYANYPKK